MKQTNSGANRASPLSEALAVAAVASSEHPSEAATALLTAAGMILDRDFGPVAASALMIDAISKARDEWVGRHAN